MDEEALEKQALEELMRDAKQGAERAKEMGAIGWQKSPLMPVNKTFLRKTLVSTLRDARPQRKRDNYHSYTKDDKPRYAREDKHNGKRTSDRSRSSYRHDKNTKSNESETTQNHEANATVIPHEEREKSPQTLKKHKKSHKPHKERKSKSKHKESRSKAKKCKHRHHKQ